MASHWFHLLSGFGMIFVRFVLTQLLHGKRKAVIKIHMFAVNRCFCYNYLRESPMDTLDRITQQPEMMGGKACIRGMRVTVGMVVGQIGAGHSIDEILSDYPYLEREDILQALRYAAWRSEEREVLLVTA
jgi:uncharacterized protein (DUF433 family)